MSQERGVLRHAKAVALCTLLSRLLGLARDILIAAMFATSGAMDAFVLAFTIPNLFRRLFGEGALSAAFIPVFTEYREKRGEADAGKLFSTIFWLLLFGLGGLLLLGWAVTLVFSRFAELSEKAGLFLQLLQIMLPYMVFICLAALVMAALNVRDRFVVPALTPAVLNVFWIGGILLLAPSMGIKGVAIAVLIGGVVQLFMQFPSLIGSGVRLRPTLAVREPGLARVGKMMGPAVLGLAVVQINVLFDRVIAEACVSGDGANSALYFGNRLVNFPIGVLGVALATAIFPALSRSAAREDRDGFWTTLEGGVRVALFLGLPAMVVSILLRRPIVELLYRRGNFGEESVTRTASVLMFYGLGLWAYLGLHTLNRAFHSLQDMATPVKVGIWMVGGNLALNLALVWRMRESGLALATAITAVLNFFVLAAILHRRLGRRDLRRAVIGLLKTVASSVACAVSCWAALRAVEGFGTGKLMVGLVRVFVPMIAGLGSFTIVSLILRSREFGDVLAALRSRKSEDRRQKAEDGKQDGLNGV